MKLMVDMSTDIQGVIELNESTGDKTYVIKGTVSSPGKKNRNGRIYPQELWESNVARYQDEIKHNTINTLCELEHPARSTVNPWEAVAKTRLLEMRDGIVYGEMEILNNNAKETNQLKALIEAGVKIGVSTRGVGRLGKGSIVEEFQLITTDIVANPSDYGANLEGFTESMIVESQDYSIDEGKVICTPAGCTLEKELAEKAEKIEEGTGSGDIAQDPVVEIKAEETLCSKRAKALIKNLSEYAEEPIELTEKAIEAFDIIALYEKRPTYKELQKKIKEIQKEMKKYKKGSDEWDVLDFELAGIEEYLAKTISKGRGPENVNEVSSDDMDEALHKFEDDIIKFQEAFGIFTIATGKVDKKASRQLPGIYKQIEELISPARKTLKGE